MPVNGRLPCRTPTDPVWLLAWDSSNKSSKPASSVPPTGSPPLLVCAGNGFLLTAAISGLFEIGGLLNSFYIEGFDCVFALYPSVDVSTGLIILLYLVFGKSSISIPEP